MKGYSEVNPAIIDRLAEIMSKLNPVEIVTPTNATEKKEAWCEKASNGIFTNPHFRYDNVILKEVASYNTELIAGMSHISSRFMPTTAAKKVVLNILSHRIVDAVACTAIASSILRGDDATTSELARQLYGHPSDTQIAKAYSIVHKECAQEQITPRFTEEEQKVLKGKKFNATEIKHWFTRVIDGYGIKGWTVEIGDQYTSIDARDRNRTGKPVIDIPTGKEVNGLKLLELVGHEINSHVRGSANCKALIEEILGKSSPLAPLSGIIAKSDNELFYEGVAKLSDVGVNGSSALPLPYATIACNLASLGGDFASIGEAIKNVRLNMGQSEKPAISGAWATTYRIKRGSTERGEKGYCFPKDHIYMSGYEVARRISPRWHNYASMTIAELQSISNITDIGSPKYPNIDVVGWLKDDLLSNTTE